MAGTFTAIGVVALGAIVFLISRCMKKKSKDEDFYLNEDSEEYVVNDRSGRTGFASVNFGQPATEMSERHSDYSRPYADNDVEHTLGQEIIQQAPFDPFHNNFNFLDHSDQGHGDEGPHGNQMSLNQAITSGFGQQSQMQMQQQHYEHEHDHDFLGPEDPTAHHWTGADPDPGAQYRNSYSQHPYASDAVHVTPLRRQPSERAEYGLAC